MVGSAMAVAAVARAVHADLRQRPHEIALANPFHVLQACAMATLALDVVVYGVLHAVPSRGRAERRVAPTVHGMAAEARVLLAGIRVQRVVRLSVLRRAPTSLEVSVAITTRRLLRCRVVVAEEARSGRWRRIERRAILVHDVVFARREHGGGDQRGLRQGERTERRDAHGAMQARCEAVPTNERSTVERSMAPSGPER